MPALLSSLIDVRRDELSAVLSADGRCRPCLRGWLDWRRRHQARSAWYHQRTRLARDTEIALVS